MKAKKPAAASSSPPQGHLPGDRTGRRVRLFAWLLLTGVVLTHYLAATYFRSAMWGMHSWAFVPRWLLALTLVLAGVVVLAVPLPHAAHLDRAGRFLRRHPLFWMSAAVFGVLWFARSRTVLPGDGLPIIFSDPPGYVLLPHEPLAGFLRQSSTVLLSALKGHALGPQERWDAVAIGSCFAGAAFAPVAWWIAEELRTLHPDRTATDGRGDQWLAFLLLMSQGYMQLFFGYVENYPYALLAVGIFLLAGLRVARRGAPLLIAPVAGLLAGLSHLSLIVLSPALVIAVAPPRRSARDWGAVAAGALATIGLVSATWYVLRRELHYDLLRQVLSLLGGAGGAVQFTVGHLGDVLNEQMLIGPVSLIAVLGFGAMCIRRGASRGVWFLVAASALALIDCWGLGDLSLGYARDWDILAPLGVVFTATVLGLLATLSPSRVSNGALRVLLACSLLHTIPWIATNASTTASLRRFATLPLGGGRTESTIAYWYRQIGERDSTKAWLDRSLARNPFNNRAAGLYGEVYLEEGKPALAARAYLMAVRARPNLKFYRRRFVEALVKAGAADDALSMARGLISMDESDPRSIALLCLVHLARGERAEGITIATRAERLYPEEASLEPIRAILAGAGTPADSVALWRFATER